MCECMFVRRYWLIPVVSREFEVFLAVSNALFVQVDSSGGAPSRLRAGLSWDSGISGLSAASHIATQLEGEQLSDIHPELRHAENWGRTIHTQPRLWFSER